MPNKDAMGLPEGWDETTCWGVEQVVDFLPTGPCRSMLSRLGCGVPCLVGGAFCGGGGGRLAVDAELEAPRGASGAAPDTGSRSPGLADFLLVVVESSAVEVVVAFPPPFFIRFSGGGFAAAAAALSAAAFFSLRAFAGSRLRGGRPFTDLAVLRANDRVTSAWRMMAWPRRAPAPSHASPISGLVPDRHFSGILAKASPLRRVPMVVISSCSTSACL